MQKVIVIGCPGSGKSTFSKALARQTDLPLFHLDMLYWNSDRTTVSKEVFLQRLHNVLQQDFWIIDGNYESTLELRMAACDTVIFLDYPVDLCLEGVQARKGKPRSDMPWIENQEETDSEFIEFIKAYRTNCRPKVIKLLQQYGDKHIAVFTNREEAAEFLQSVIIDKHSLSFYNEGADL